MFRIAVLLMLIGFAVYIYYPLPEEAQSTTETAPLEETSEKTEALTKVFIAHGMARDEVSRTFGDALSWDARAMDNFAAIYAQVQWAALNDEAVAVFSELVPNDTEAIERFSESSSKYLEPRYDFLSTVHASGTYEFQSDASHAEIAAFLVERLEDTYGDGLAAFTREALEPEATDAVIALITGERELLPDLVPLPPRDLVLQEILNGVRLAFSTTYYNKGDGPLELIADPETIGVPGDIPRDVVQRIYKEDGSYEERPAGTFLWHHPHIHYHFADFVVYSFEPVDVPDAVDLGSVEQKSTFCVRDVSIVDLELEFRREEAAYQICGRERQGISVGWGDTYFFTYPDQNIDVTGFPSGTYRLSFHVNPENRLEEISKENNTSSVLFSLDQEAATVTIIEETPAVTPSVEHIYEE